MKELASQLQAIIDRIVALCRQTDFAEWDIRPGPGKWSKKEVIGHLIDSANNNIQRFVRCTYEEKFKVVYYQNEWVSAQQYQQADTRELLELWRLLNAQIVRIFHSYPEDRLAVLCDVGKEEVNLQTIQDIAQDYLRHLAHHLAASIEKPMDQILRQSHSTVWPEKEISVERAGHLLKESGKLFTEVFAHGTLVAEFYKPEKIDKQQPHDRDEIYVVASGTGTFQNGGKTWNFQPGDFLFVPAGVEHRFVNFTGDFATWVFFYGPVGGEKNVI